MNRICVFLCIVSMLFILVILAAPNVVFANSRLDLNFPSSVENFANNFSPQTSRRPPPPRWEHTMHKAHLLTRRQEGLDVRGFVPHIFDFHAADYLNEHITYDVVSSLIAEARRIRARAVTFSWEYHPTDDVISFVIYANVTTTLPHTLVRSVNFCADTGELLTMNEATGLEISALVERVLEEKIRANPEFYYAAISALVTDAYFLTEDSISILFDGFRLSTRISNVETIELLLHNIRAVTLDITEYRLDGPYELKMIPLSSVIWDLGYGLRWCDITGHGRAIIDRNGVDFIEMRIRDNEYLVHGTQRRSLEVAPRVFRDRNFGNTERTYVPITFFDQILPLTTYTIDMDGNITFLTYFD